jgi:antitoxin YefM
MGHQNREAMAHVGVRVEPTVRPRSLAEALDSSHTAIVQCCVQQRSSPIMDAISYSSARANLASTMDRVCEDHEALIITRNGQQSVVMLSLEDFTALEETAYLLRSPANAKRLMGAIEQLNAGAGTERELAE